MGAYKYLEELWERSNPMLWDSFSELDHGNTDNYQLSKESQDQADQKRPENWVTRESKDMLSTELESEEVEERSPFPRESFTESQLTKV